MIISSVIIWVGWSCFWHLSNLFLWLKKGYTCAATIFLFGARHYEKPSKGHGDLGKILLGGAYVAFSVILYCTRLSEYCTVD